MKISRYVLTGAAVLTMGLTSCVNDLNVDPESPNTKLDLTTAEEYYQLLARAYGGLVLEGGITVDDGGAGVYTRQLWNLQELTTDEALIGRNWDDPGIDELDFMTWSTTNHWLYECFCRFNFQISTCNEFLRTIDKAKGLIPDNDIQVLKAEARVLRDLSYYHMIDTFGKGPFTDENSVVGAIPPTYTRKQLFDFVVNDLKENIPSLIPAARQVYGRLSQEAGRMLLAKMYLNAEVYTGTPMWTECAEQCKEIAKTIAWDPNLEYKYIFCADNDRLVGNGEIIWGIPQDTNTLQTYGGTTYLSGGAYNSDALTAMADANGGIQPTGIGVGGWGGARVRPELSQALAANDKRRLIYEGDFHESLDVLTGDWKIDGYGYMCVKYVYTPSTNYDNAGGTATTSNVFNSTDYPLFRLADVYLMLAECQLNGEECNGLEYYNKVRLRAGLAPIGSYTADDLLKERLCELYWEGHRRSDLVRFGKFAGRDYLWSWKGGVLEGSVTPETRNLFAIPSEFVSTLGQNPGY